MKDKILQVLIDHDVEVKEGIDKLVYDLEEMFMNEVISNQPTLNMQAYSDTEIKCSCGKKYSIPTENGFHKVPYRSMTNICSNCGMKFNWELTQIMELE